MSNFIKATFLLIFAISFLACNSIDASKKFSLMPSSHTGIKFKNILKETEGFNVLTYGQIYNGGGVSVGDINNDGLVDLYFTGNMVGSRLYLNQGNLKFKEIAQEAGVFAEGLWNTGTTMADVNGDGYLDIYVCRSAAKEDNKRRNLLFINNGDLTFTEKASAFGLDDSGYSSQGAFFDYDKDGDLDFYLVNHSTQEYSGFRMATGASKALKEKRNPNFADKLFRNDNGKFINVSDEVGLVSNVLGFGLGIAVSDINNDGWPDLYVSNDFHEQDYLYINNQNGTFTESLEKYIGHVSHFSMGSDIADINNDGFTEIMTLDMLPEGNQRIKMVSGPDNYDKNSLLEKNGFYHQIMRNMMHLNQNGQYFSEIGQFSGISNTDWSWASLFADFDNDGYKDLFVTNGFKKDYTNMDFMNFAVQEKLNENNTGVEMAITTLLENMPATVEENYIFKNNGDLTFEKVNTLWGLDQKTLSNGAAYADLDNDGDLDLIVNNTDELASVYRNNTNSLTENRFIKFSLKGDDKNTFGIGAKIILGLGNTTLSQEMMPTRGFQSSVDHNLVFGLGENNNIDEAKIIWPDGREQILKGLKANQSITVWQKEASTPEIADKLKPKTYFSAISSDSLLDFVHIENDYVDFRKEQLLPHMLSTQGPKIASADLNGDGLEDLFVGGAHGQSGKIFLQTKSGLFFDNTKNAFSQDNVAEDLGGLFFDADNDGDQDLYVVSGGNEFEPNSPELQDRIYFNDGSGNFIKKSAALPTMLTSGSCVRASDIDSDGDLDLFVGGRLVPGQYPTAPRSYILENDGKGNFTDITIEISIALVNIGLVTDAIWSDFNGDGKEDLIVVGEFMGVRAFENQNGKLVEVAKNSGLDDSEGWWNTIKKGDFDGDGDEDYILGNFGLNSQLKASVSEPVELFAKDFDNNGSLDPILCSYVMGESFPVFSKDDIIGQLGYLKSKYVNYADYANAKITDIFDQSQLKGAQVLKAVNFTTSYMENLGGSTFKISPLPNAAQFSPVYGVLVKDFNQDGQLDVLLAGNFFGTRVKYGRYDANKGVLLLGDGKGKFNAVDVASSGLNIDGEVRDIATLTIGSKEILIFARNNAGLKLYVKTDK